MNRRGAVASGLTALALMAGCGPAGGLGMRPDARSTAEETGRPDGGTSAVGATTLEGDVVRLDREEDTALVVQLDGAAFAEARRQALGVISGAARRSEHVLILCGDRVLQTTVSPSGADIAERVGVPDPSALPEETDVQRVRKQEAQRKRLTAVASAQSRAVRRGEQELASWMTGVRHALLGSTCTGQGIRALDGALGRAEVFLDALDEAHVDVGVRREVLVLGISGIPASPLPHVFAHVLSSTTVVVFPFPGDAGQAATWQAAFLATGARRAVLLPSAADPNLLDVIRSGLASSGTEYAADILFALGSANPDPGAVAVLTAVLTHLREIRISEFTVLLHGFADGLGTPRANDQLSQDRADAVRTWLVRHGVDPRRIRAVGHGNTDPVAQETPLGQPRNRHVILVVRPTG